MPSERLQIPLPIVPVAIVRCLSFALSCSFHSDLSSCSIACFKQHKETHANDSNQKAPPAKVDSAHIEAIPLTAPSTTANAPLGRSKKINFAGFESDPELLRLLSRYPNLRIQLQSVYGLTLEPPPAGMSNSYRGRGRGRGGRFNQQSHWSQAKGDKEATESFKNMRNAESDAQALTEFVQLLKMRFAPDLDTDSTT